jgi:hypothetical protein
VTSILDERRFAYCLIAAAVLHAAGAIAPRLRFRRHHEAPPKMERVLVPVALEEPTTRPPAPPPPPAPPKPVAPKPVAPKPPPPAAALTNHEPPAPPKGDHPARAPHPSPRAARTPNGDKPPEHQERRKKDDESASPFTGTEGAFGASVCLIARNVRSAHAVDGCEPVTAFRTSKIDVAPRRFTEGFPGVGHRVDWFGIDYRGSFKVRKADYFTFRLLSDDGALLFIDGNQVIDNDGQHGPRSEAMSLPLTKGDHEFRLLYYQGPGGSLALQLFVKTYKSDERLFGPEL